VLLFMFFILAGSGDFIAKVQRIVSRHQSRAMATMLENIDRRMRQYLIAKTLISLLTGTVTTLTLLILGVDFALVWGFLTFLLNFIPTIGSIVAVFFPFLFSLLQFETFTIPLLVLIILSVLQNSIGNVLEPRFMAHSLDLSPLLVLVSLILWGWMWGIWGMVLSIPIMATIKIICENVETLAPVAALMSGRVEDRKVKKKDAKPAV
jgi:predicted PurR-regulated permease PerM